MLSQKQDGIHPTQNVLQAPTSSTAATCIPMGESRAPWPPCRASSRPPRRGGRPTRRPRRASRAARPQTGPPRRPRRASRAAPRVEGHAAPEEAGAHAGGESHRRGRSPYPQSSTSTPIRPARAELAQRSPRADLRWGGGKEGREEGLRGSGGAAARVSEHRRIRGIGGDQGSMRYKRTLLFIFPN